MVQGQMVKVQKQEEDLEIVQIIMGRHNNLIINLDFTSEDNNKEEVKKAKEEDFVDGSVEEIDKMKIDEKINKHLMNEDTASVDYITTIDFTVTLPYNYEDDKFNDKTDKVASNYIKKLLKVKLKGVDCVEIGDLER